MRSIASVLLLIIVLLSGCLPPKFETTGAKSVPAPKGSVVRDGKFEFQVVDVSRAPTAGNSNNQSEIVTAQGEFIIVTLSVKNVGNTPQPYFGQNQMLVDTSGREYGANSYADKWMNSRLAHDINPGNSIQAKQAFDVPPGAQPASLEVHYSLTSNGAKVQL